MTEKEKKQRIKNSKLFLEKFKTYKIQVETLENLINDLLESQKPAGYKEDLRIYDLKVQKSKKNQNTEDFLNNLNDTVEKYNKELERLQNSKLYCMQLINKLKNINEKIILNNYYILNKNFKDLTKFSKSSFFRILDEGLINFSYILEEEYKKRIEKKKENEEKKI